MGVFYVFGIPVMIVERGNREPVMSNTEGVSTFPFFPFDVLYIQFLGSGPCVFHFQWT